VFKNHKDTVVVKYPKYSKVFDYVHNLFPNSNVKKATVYLCNANVLRKEGFVRMGGIYSLSMKMIVVARSKIKGKWKNFAPYITVDETMVHELLHYASDHMVKGKFRTVASEEEFAYGFSIPYFLKKKWNRKKIINKYFLPYLITTINSGKVRNKILKANGHKISDFNKMSDIDKARVVRPFQIKISRKIKEKAIKQGEKLFDTYSKKIKTMNNKDNTDGDNEFDLMDLTVH
jgi:hypothetical protein